MNKDVMVSIVMGSKSDAETMKEAATVLKRFGVLCEMRVISAHRTPLVAHAFARDLEGRGVRLVIAGAGKAAHLAGVIASLATIPVIGVPMKTSDLGGLDSLLSTVQMPGDVPVATVGAGMGGPRNAGLLAAQIIALSDPSLQERLAAFKQSLYEKVTAKNESLQSKIAAEK